MAAVLVVDSGYLSPYALSAFVALRRKAIPFSLRTIDLRNGEQHSAPHAALSLTERVPALVVDGWTLSESSAIAEYLDEAWPVPPLYPQERHERARARQLQAWLRSDLGDLRAERSTEVVFLGRRGPALSPSARAQADKLLRVASTLVRPGQATLFAQWCIADIDLALMLQRLVRHGDAVPQALVDYAEGHWNSPDVQAWRSLPRQASAGSPQRDDVAPGLARVDHIHVFVADRDKAATWYRNVLGLTVVPHLAHWAADGGPLTLGDRAGAVHLALFERVPQPCRTTIAFGVDAASFLRWHAWLGRHLQGAVRLVDHAIAWSMYFEDPDGNPFEITTYDHERTTSLLSS